MVGTKMRSPMQLLAFHQEKAPVAKKPPEDGAADGAKATAGKVLPAAGRFLSRFVYTTSYTFSYGVVFPAYVTREEIDSPDNAACYRTWGLSMAAHAAK